jgi:hypothetical protein
MAKDGGSHFLASWLGGVYPFTLVEWWRSHISPLALADIAEHRDKRHPVTWRDDIAPGKHRHRHHYCLAMERSITQPHRLEPRAAILAERDGISSCMGLWLVLVYWLIV